MNTTSIIILADAASVGDLKPTTKVVDFAGLLDIIISDRLYPGYRHKYGRYWMQYKGDTSPCKDGVGLSFRLVDDNQYEVEIWRRPEDIETKEGAVDTYQVMISSMEQIVERLDKITDKLDRGDNDEY